MSQRDNNSYHSSSSHGRSDHHYNGNRGYKREGSSSSSSSNYSSEGSRHPPFNNNNFGPPSSSYRSRNDDHFQQSHHNHSSNYRYDNNRQYNSGSTHEERGNNSNLKRTYDEYKQETIKPSNDESNSSTFNLQNTLKTPPPPSSSSNTNSSSITSNSSSTSHSTTNNTPSTANDENEKKKARLEAWKKKKEMGALQKLEEEKKQKTTVPPPTSISLKPPIKKPLSFGTKKSIVNNNTKISAITHMEDDEVNSSIKSLNFLDDDENVTNISEDEDDELEKYMSGIHNELKQTEKSKEIDNGTLSNDNTELYSTEKKAQMLFSDDNDEVDIDSYFIAKDDINTTPRNLEGLSEFQKQSKKDLKAVDHSKMEYLPFRKNFFIIPREYSSLNESEIAELRKEMGQIKVHGHDIPPPVKSWTQCGLNDTILGVIEKCGYEKPFAIQSQALPCIMSGRNIIGIAKTGSGKTLAFVLPMLRHVLDQPLLKFGDGPIGIVMAPTRELAIQIHSEMEVFTSQLNLKTACVYGGASIAEQIALLKNGAHIIVCTPGRLIDLLCANRGRVTNLTRVSFVVLDEADRMFDMGFGPQVMRILTNVQPERQLVMFSATFPRQLEALAKKVMKNSIEIIVGGRSVASENIKQFVEIYEDDSNRFLRLLELLGKYNVPGSSILIFVDSQNGAGDLYKDLASAGYRDCVCTLHGGMDQIERDCTITDFKSQKFTILIGTSICARGLDVPSIRLVVNYNCPDHYEDYVHRVGRTGRAGKKGVAYTFISPIDEEKYAPDLVKALKQSNNPIPDELQKLCDNFLTKKNLGLVQGQRRNALPGFVGTGFKFDAKEENQKMEEKKQLAFSYAISNNDEGILDQIDIQDVDEKKKDKSQKKKPKREETVLDKATKAADAVYKDIEKDETITEEEKAIQRAQLFAAALTVHTSISEKQKEKELSQMILAGVVNISGLFRTEVEINDWPRAARIDVLKKDNLHSVQHFTNTKIQIKGNYVPPEVKHSAQKGERKQYLVIEGANEAAVQQARSQILAVLGESSSVGDKRVTGRFQIV